MKTLILNGTTPVRLSLDGPALAVLEPAKAARLYPFSRIGRIVVGGRVQCEAAALARCLRQGIPITFVAGEEGAAGVAMPLSSEAPGTARMLESFVALPRWRERYGDWKRAAERREILDVLRRLRLRAPDLRPATVAAFLMKELMRQHPGAQVERWRAAAAALLTARIASRLAHGRMGGVLPALEGVGLRLLADFTAILEWRFYADCREWLAADPTALDGAWKSKLVALVEERAPRDEARIQSLWDRFCYWLGGML
ncbi:MAG TPA: CRISPR-associated endonuclease Cas1 [Bryobacteraceae bacterium]|nr:CRISPR-associated endonuclease Cas1 [Bryobacteraceae bacterium]HPU73304.1 CRISPR-associated endonuclease Cas1 [Bryobacteraceae bacterium]